MDFNMAFAIIGLQNKSISKVDGVKFILGKYEYRLIYRGGFGAYVGIDRREVGKRNFKYFGGVGAYHCGTVAEVAKLVVEYINNKR